MKKFSLILLTSLLAACSSYKDARTPSDILNIYNEAALSFDFEAIDRITHPSDLKVQLADALDFMSDNHKFFTAIKAKFPQASDKELIDKFPLLFEIYRQMAAKKSQGFKEIDYKIDYQGEQAMIFEIASKKMHLFKQKDGVWKKAFAEDEINFHRFSLPDKETFMEYMKFIAESKTFKEFKDHWVEEPVEEININAEAETEEVDK